MVLGFLNISTADYSLVLFHVVIIFQLDVVLLYHLVNQFKPSLYDSRSSSIRTGLSREVLQCEAS